MDIIHSFPNDTQVPAFLSALSTLCESSKSRKRAKVVNFLFLFPVRNQWDRRKVTYLPAWGFALFLVSFLMSKHLVNRFLIPNWSHPPTQDQNHTFPGEEEIFGCPGITVCPSSPLCTIPGSSNPSEPDFEVIIASWLGDHHCPSHRAPVLTTNQGFPRGACIPARRGVQLSSNPAQRRVLQVQTALEKRRAQG